jgi:hypothetical protein
MALKDNQAKSLFSFKNDDRELVELGQFIRATTEFRVEREWYIVFNKMTGEYVGFTSNALANPIYKIRNPDLILIDKNTSKIVLIIEVDGSVHDVHFADTEQRNEEYFMAGLPLLVINKLEVDTTLIDFVNKKLRKRLGI